MRDKFPLAGAPDLVRSNQKDEYYVNHLEGLLRDAGVQFNHSKVYSELLYYFLTYGCNSMTLGEEYCDIQQIFKGLNPSVILKVEYIFFKFSSFILNLRVILPLLFDRGLYFILKRTSSNYRIQMERIRNLLPFIFRFHLSLFYIQGKYLDLTKRILNLKYVIS
jgi:peroxin-10